MAKDLTTKTFTDPDTGLLYEVSLKDIYASFGGRVEIVTVKNAGKENEKRTPAASVQINVPVNTAPESEGYDQKIKDHPYLKDFIALTLEEAIKPYKD